MTITLELPPDLEARLSEEAASSNISEEKLAFQLIAMALPPPEFKSNAEAIDYWKQIGLIGMWADREDMKDSTAWVQQQRDKSRMQSQEKMRGVK
jgi:hypothetical protein